MRITTKKKESLDIILEEYGEEWVKTQIITRIADGDSPKEIAKVFGVHYVLLRKWIEDNCSDDVALAGRARADILEYKATEIIDNVVPDTLGVVKLQSDYYLKLAGKLDRKKYGDKTDSLTLAVQVNTNIISADVSPHEAAQAYASMVGKQNG